MYITLERVKDTITGVVTEAITSTNTKLSAAACLVMQTIAEDQDAEKLVFECIGEEVMGVKYHSYYTNNSHPIIVDIRIYDVSNCVMTNDEDRSIMIFAEEDTPDVETDNDDRRARPIYRDSSDNN